MKREIACEYRGLSSGLAGVGVTPKWSCKAHLSELLQERWLHNLRYDGFLQSTMLSFEDLRAMSDGVARTLSLVFGEGAGLGLFFFPLQRCKRNTGDQVVGVGDRCL